MEPFCSIVDNYINTKIDKITSFSPCVAAHRINHFVRWLLPLCEKLAPQELAERLIHDGDYFLSNDTSAANIAQFDSAVLSQDKKCSVFYIDLNDNTIQYKMEVENFRLALVKCYETFVGAIHAETTWSLLVQWYLAEGYKRFIIVVNKL